MASQGSSRTSKRKRSVSDLDDIENCSDPSWTTERTDHQRKRLRDTTAAGPSSPSLVPLSPHNQCLTPDASPKRITTSDSTGAGSSCGLMPTLTWLNKCGMVDHMNKKDLQGDIDGDYFSRHPNLQPRMRSVLLDWLMEVCEAYKMHRETYYLAVNYIDRYLSRMKHVAKNQLQLIGITCLFIASKVEEIYPPKLNEFAYVTNEACTTEGILSQELVVLSCLDWNMGALTVSSWMSLLLQLWHNREATPKSIVFPNHPVKDYLLTANLLDLSMLDDGCLRFPYLTLAAASIHLMTDYKQVISSPPVAMTENDKFSVMECVAWMSPFAEQLKETQELRKPTQPDYEIQSHTVDLQLLEQVQQRMRNLQYSSVAMTPPLSSEKKP